MLCKNNIIKNCIILYINVSKFSVATSSHLYFKSYRTVKYHTVIIDKIDKNSDKREKGRRQCILRKEKCVDAVLSTMHEEPTDHIIRVASLLKIAA